MMPAAHTHQQVVTVRFCLTTAAAAQVSRVTRFIDPTTTVIWLHPIIPILHEDMELQYQRSGTLSRYKSDGGQGQGPFIQAEHVSK